VLASRKGDAGVSHSNSLLRDIQDMMEEAKRSISEVDVFAAAVGPGSFTGLRIGLSTVKGLAATTGRKSIGIPTLEAIAHAAGPSKATVSLLPAGRGELFVQSFSVTEEGTVTPLDQAAHLSPHHTIERYQSMRELKWAGAGALQHRELLQQQEGLWSIAPAEELLAKNIALMSVSKFEGGELLAPEDLHAVYVRPSDAELKTNVVHH
jgi:tRNA threonylcarbamoyladenosine biosynthesis protein TsaB